jgi:ATP-dependent DNA helicase RecQ
MHLKQVINQYISGNALVFLKGFGLEYYNELLKTYQPLYFQGESISLVDLTNRKRELMRSVIGSENEFRIGIYEELLILGESINDLTDSNITVIENNYYDGIFPAEYDDETLSFLREIMDSINNEVTENDENVKIAEIISNIELIDREIFVHFMNPRETVRYTKSALFDTKDNQFDLSEMQDDVLFSNYYIDNVQEICRLKRHLETNKLTIKEINLKAERSINKSTLNSLAPIRLVYPDILIKVYAEDRLKPIEIREEFSNILQKYWGTNLFREIDFYENPAINLQKIKISQGTIVQSIVTQAESARNGADHRFQDIFVTAPTGAGKSLLYQIPAIYLAQQYNLVTIVISPLKSLMLDQVRQLKEKGVDCVEYINSDLSQIQKQDILESVKSGKTSILYVSPELLLAYDIRSLIGDERKIGLLVVDEAHLVTTWGRDFRIDYWYLGSYIKKLRDNRYIGIGQSFVVAAFTATAVYGGNDDMVFETINSLNMLNPIKYLGNVRRDDISFKISKWEIRRSYEEERRHLTIARIREFMRLNKKAIIYAPFRRHTNDIYDELDPTTANKTVRYHAGMESAYKEHFEQRFRNGEATIMLATKAFGMGVDISDIEIVYHHAPTGNLCDYVQEIGRAGRATNMQGYAVQDFNERYDLHYAKILYGLSGMRQYQLREVLKKLYNIYLKEGRRNFLVNAESFRHIFNDQDDYESKLKNALLLLEKDLHGKYGYPILIIRPKSLFSKAYAAISDEILNEFLASPYAAYVRKLSDANSQSITNGNQNLTIRDVGPIYEINLKRLWEDKFANITFPNLKHLFYEKELFEDQYKKHIHPRYQLILRFQKNDPELITEDFNKHSGIIATYLSGPARRGFFTKENFRKYLKDEGYPEVERRKIANALIDLFVIKQNMENKYAFLQKRNTHKESFTPEEPEEYRVANLNYLKIFNETATRLNNLSSTIQDGEVSQFLAVKQNDPFMILAYMVEALSMGSYEVRGGASPEIFIRINDPYRISTLVANVNTYSNSILRDIKERQDRSFSILREFFVSLDNDQQRWDYVEKYFLGRLSWDG